MKWFVVVLAMVCTVASPGAAQTADQRLRFVEYSTEQIVPLRGHLGYQMMIEFNADERIENVSIGDSLAWQVTPNRAATVLFLKPLQRHAATNMNVVTNRRLYSFDLSAAEARSAADPSIIYRVSFHYPPSDEAVTAEANPTPPPVFNFHYTYPSAERLAPRRVFDDGTSTYFEFSPDVDMPAIFILDGEEEEVANAQARGEFLVVDRLAPAFVLRYGRRQTIVRNDGMAQGGAP
jgi:type IV secretion system protein VirB9